LGVERGRGGFGCDEMEVMGVGVALLFIREGVGV
jgi:hypothetical protein